MGRPRKGVSVEDRFWSKVDKTESCWVWEGGLSTKGYGQIQKDGKAVMVHRLAYELAIGPITEGMVLDHLCRNRRCVNPDHLRVVSHRENILSGEGHAARHAAQTHCIYGHPFDEENTRYYQTVSGIARDCRECTRIYGAEYKRKRRAS